MAQMAPTTQITNTKNGDPRSPARNPVVVKIPDPTMFDTTSAVALTTPNCRNKSVDWPARAPPGACATLDIVSCHPTMQI
jgi:hypothetical protein